MSLRKPVTGEAAAEIRVWFTTSGSSPSRPYFERKRMERRYIKVPGRLLRDTKDDQWSIDTENGTTFDPEQDR